MSFTDAELAVLSQLSYCDEIVMAGTAQQPLSELIKQKKSYLQKQLGESFYGVIENMIRKTEGKDFMVVKGVNDVHGTGFAAFAVQDPENNVTVACRGTQGFSMDYDSRKDVYADIQLGIAEQADQHNNMEQFMRELDQDGYNGYYFTGHSLGGNLAMHGAISLSDSTKVLGVTTFNAPGFNAGYWTKYNLQIQKIENRMHAYQNEYDYVSSCFKTPGEISIVDSFYPEGHFGFDHHGISGFRLDADGSFVLNESGRKGIRTGVVDYFTDIRINSIWAVLNVFGYCRYKQNAKKNIVRDFSPEVREMMINAARETEEEKWWQVSRWDCWYRMGNFLGVLEIDRYAGDVNKYYRKLIDINDASCQTIEKIFSDAYALDNDYAGKIHSELEAFVTAMKTYLGEHFRGTISSGGGYGGGSGGGRFGDSSGGGGGRRFGGSDTGGGGGHRF